MAQTAPVVLVAYGWSDFSTWRHGQFHGFWGPNWEIAGLLRGGGGDPSWAGSQGGAESQSAEVRIKRADCHCQSFEEVEIVGAGESG